MKVIGIAGPSCSGKSTVAQLVAKQLGASFLSLDVQIIKGLPHVFVDGVRTLERPQFYDGNKLADVVRHLQTDGKYTFTEYRHSDKSWVERTEIAKEFLILEGFLLFQYPELQRVCDLKFYIDLPWDESVRRRKARNRGDKSDEWFYQIGESESALFVVPQKKMPRAIVLDGMKSAQQLANDIINISRTQ